MRVLALLLSLGLTVPAVAQEFPKPGPEHEMLKKLVGDWTFTMKMADAESKGTVTYKMELGGMWLTGTMESELFGQKFIGKSLESFNMAKKKYVSIWVDSMSTAPVIMEGDYDAEKKSLTMVGEGPGMDGMMMKYKSLSVFPDSDTIKFTMYMGDGKEPAFTVLYKRKK